MSRSVKAFADTSLKVVAVRAADRSDFGFEFPASGPQSTPSEKLLAELQHELGEFEAELMKLKARAPKYGEAETRINRVLTWTQLAIHNENHHEKQKHRSVGAACS